MAFTVETGAGLPDANAYISVAFYRAYFADRGIDVSSETDQQIQGWIVQATDYIQDYAGRGRLKGASISQTQALFYPADGIYIGCNLQASDEVPMGVQRATAELARQAKSGSLYVTPTADASGLQVTSKREKVGPLEREWGYLAGSQSTRRSFPQAEKWLRPLLKGNGGGVIRN